MKLKKKIAIKKRQQKKKLESSCHTCNTDYKIELTTYKTNRYEP